MRSRVALVVLAVVVGACTDAPTPSPTPPATPEIADKIVIGHSTVFFAPPLFLAISNRPAVPFRPPGGRPELSMELVYNALYRYDDALNAVPDLAAEPCEVAPDLVTITCTLVDATFHNGTPLTADDVAYTFELGLRHPDCEWGLSACFARVLESVTAVDERTVEFRLRAPDATFLTLVLPSVIIDSRAVIEDAYVPLAEAAPSLDAAEYHAAADAIFAELGAEEPDCEAPLAGAEQLLEAATIEPLPRDHFVRADGSFDACQYAERHAVLLGGLALSLESTGLDAVAFAYQALPFNRAPIGTGPYRFVGVESGTRAVFEAFEDFHRGLPATQRIEIQTYRDFDAGTAAMRDGEVHWLTIPDIAPEIYEQLRLEPDIEFASFPDSTYFLLVYNLRDGMLFADRNLRVAVEMCVDKPATVDAATDGRGDVLYSPIEPASWAYEPNLPRPQRDVDEARRLIESSGWIEGDDGVYVRDGRRLATDVFVRGDDAQRVEFMDLLAEQARDCGILLRVVPADAVNVLGPLGQFPHIPGGYDEPFEAFFIGFNHGFDPHDETWHSRQISSAEQPIGTLNFMGFSNERADQLLDDGIATYDQRERARIYREFQQVVVEEHAALFGWAGRVHEAVDPRLGLTDGELNLSARQWYWELEKLVLTVGD